MTLICFQSIQEVTLSLSCGLDIHLNVQAKLGSRFGIYLIVGDITEHISYNIFNYYGLLDW